MVTFKSAEMEPSISSNAVKRRNIFLLRGALVAALGGLVFDAGVESAGVSTILLLIVFALSDALVLWTPLRVVASPQFNLLVGAADIIFVLTGILLLGGASAKALLISYFLMALVAVLTHYRSHMLAGAAAVGALHSWLVLETGVVTSSQYNLVLQILFLCTVGIYYGYLAESIHRSRRESEMEQLEVRELTALLNILDTITSSLDLREVTHGIVSQIAKIVPAVRCSLLFLDETSKQCLVMSSHDDPDVYMLEIDLEKYPEIRQAIKTRNPVVIQDVASDPLMDDVKEVLKHLDFHSILVIPLTFGEDILGTLCLKTARDNQEFTAREIKFCTAVARASANAFKNAMLHRQVIKESGGRHRTIRKLERVLDHSPDFILTTDKDGLITEFNHSAERLSGYGKKEMLGKSFRALFGEKGDGELVDHICTAGEISRYSTSLTRKSGSEVNLELNMSILRNEENDLIGTVWLGRDVTELKAAQSQLLQAEKLSAIGEAISGVTHELNNPLSVVLGFSQLLMVRNAGSPMTRELEKIHESAIRCQKIVKNLLSFVRGYKPEHTYLGINGILEKTVDLVHDRFQENDIEIVMELSPQIPRTMLDFHRVQQVFLNLINNARQSMMATRDRPARLLIRTSHGDGMIRATVADNGEGMDKATQKRIFDPFFTTKKQGGGTGLGLSVSYGIVREHGGQISCHSRPGEGTTFAVDLPILENEGTPAGADLVDSGDRTGDGKYESSILVVDDEPMIIDLLLEVLRDQGHRLDTASNGEEACRKVLSNTYDLVITDIRMPRMNGIEFYSTVVDERPDIKGKVIFTTGDLNSQEILDFFATVDAWVLPKPLEADGIRDMVSKVLQANAAHGQKPPGHPPVNPLFG